MRRGQTDVRKFSVVEGAAQQGDAPDEVRDGQATRPSQVISVFGRRKGRACMGCFATVDPSRGPAVPARSGGV